MNKNEGYQTSKTFTKIFQMENLWWKTTNYQEIRKLSILWLNNRWIWMFLLSEKLQNIKCNLQILSRKVQNSMKFQNSAINHTKQISSNGMISADINIDFVGKRGDY